MDGCSSLELPPGFRFHPTDEEIITHYLTPKILNHGFTARAMGAVDLNKCEPWDLPSKAKNNGGEKEWYFFCQRDRKYPTGMRTNRATESGYWKATGKDKEICGGRGVLVGMKKTLVFYAGRAPKGEKTNWVMHEYRIEGRSSALSNLPKSSKDEWVVCRVFHKNSAAGKRCSFADDLMIMEDSPTVLPPLLMDPVDLFCPGVDGDESFRCMEEMIMASSAHMANYSCSFSSVVGFDDDMIMPPPQMQNPINYACLPGEMMSYLNQDPQLVMQSSALSPIRRLCKAEQLSNGSMLSQDTGGLIPDYYTEISSSDVSKHDIDAGS